HRLDDLQERFERIALPSGQRILERDDRQLARPGDAAEMLDRHLGRWPMVNGPGGNTRSAAAPPSAAIFAMRAASRLPSPYTPLTIGSCAPMSSFAIASTRFCSSKVQDATSVECALTVIAERPS